MNRISRTLRSTGGLLTRSIRSTERIHYRGFHSTNVWNKEQDDSNKKNKIRNVAGAFAKATSQFDAKLSKDESGNFVFTPVGGEKPEKQAPRQKPKVEPQVAQKQDAPKQDTEYLAYVNRLRELAGEEEERQLIENNKQLISEHKTMEEVAEEEIQAEMDAQKEEEENEYAIKFVSKADSNNGDAEMHAFEIDTAVENHQDRQIADFEDSIEAIAERVDRDGNVIGMWNDLDRAPARDYFYAMKGASIPLIAGEQAGLFDTIDQTRSLIDELQIEQQKNPIDKVSGYTPEQKELFQFVSPIMFDEPNDNGVEPIAKKYSTYAAANNETEMLSEIITNMVQSPTQGLTIDPEAYYNPAAWEELKKARIDILLKRGALTQEIIDAYRQDMPIEDIARRINVHLSLKELALVIPSIVADSDVQNQMAEEAEDFEVDLMMDDAYDTWAAPELPITMYNKHEPAESVVTILSTKDGDGVPYDPTKQDVFGEEEGEAEEGEEGEQQGEDNAEPVTMTKTVYNGQEVDTYLVSDADSKFEQDDVLRDVTYVQANEIISPPPKHVNIYAEKKGPIPDNLDIDDIAAVQQATGSYNVQFIDEKTLIKLGEKHGINVKKAIKQRNKALKAEANSEEIVTDQDVMEMHHPIDQTHLFVQRKLEAELNYDYVSTVVESFLSRGDNLDNVQKEFDPSKTRKKLELKDLLNFAGSGPKKQYINQAISDRFNIQPVTQTLKGIRTEGMPYDVNPTLKNAKIADERVRGTELPESNKLGQIAFDPFKWDNDRKGYGSKQTAEYYRDKYLIKKERYNERIENQWRIWHLKHEDDPNLDLETRAKMMNEHRRENLQPWDFDISMLPQIEDIVEEEGEEFEDHIIAVEEKLRHRAFLFHNYIEEPRVPRPYIPDVESRYVVGKRDRRRLVHAPLESYFDEIVHNIPQGISTDIVRSRLRQYGRAIAKNTSFSLDQKISMMKKLRNRLVQDKLHDMHLMEPSTRKSGRPTHLHTPIRNERYSRHPILMKLNRRLLKKRLINPSGKSKRSGTRV